MAFDLGSVSATLSMSIRRRILARLPDMDPALQAEVLKACRDIASSEAVLGDLAAALPGELADLQGLLHDTLAAADTTLADVLDTLQRDFLEA
jgi:hypothetical protein